MASIPGKTCGSCTMCCKILEIEHFEKPAGKWCVHCDHGSGCAIYQARPSVCREYECLWMMDRTLPPPLRPDKVGTILMDDPDSDNFLAVCDPERPLAWRHPLVFRELLARAREGRFVVAKAGLKAWRVFESGEWGPWS